MIGEQRFNGRLQKTGEISDIPIFTIFWSFYVMKVHFTIQQIFNQGWIEPTPSQLCLCHLPRLRYRPATINQKREVNQVNLEKGNGPWAIPPKHLITKLCQWVTKKYANQLVSMRELQWVVANQQQWSLNTCHWLVWW